MSMQSRYRFTTAWLPVGWRRNVVISVDPAGDIVDVATDDVVTTARLVNGAAIPCMPNAHSHAFHRALRFHLFLDGPGVSAVVPLQSSAEFRIGLSFVVKVHGVGCGGEKLD